MSDFTTCKKCGRVVWPQDVDADKCCVLCAPSGTLATGRAPDRDSVTVQIQEAHARLAEKGDA